MDIITFKADHMAEFASTRTFLSGLPRDLAVSEPRVELRHNSCCDSHRIVAYDWHFSETVRNLDAFNVTPMHL